MLSTPEIREKLEAQGAEVRTNTPDAFAAFQRDETARWAKVVSANGVKLDEEPMNVVDTRLPELLRGSRPLRRG